MNWNMHHHQLRGSNAGTDFVLSPSASLAANGDIAWRVDFFTGDDSEPDDDAAPLFQGDLPSCIAWVEAYVP